MVGIICRFPVHRNRSRLKSAIFTTDKVDFTNYHGHFSSFQLLINIALTILNSYRSYRSYRKIIVFKCYLIKLYDFGKNTSSRLH